ncbi:CtsR family transcriptional regulator [Proteiniborus sp. MB09-C3]|uniref:CtsR family transcriptional regulator n=1 Tax=Proteiniborus sp. MB09-C3 TaxID=3050072 RepID=UPI0025579043|nr:CtsR family transcriptional regulator [Proteiniborus sp. MB09-C3]WIV13109.1 CtsR family transcriptional regulator [Proteiniborus sp. MB09-C3]
MSKLSNLIEDFIKKLLEDANNGVIEIQRNELAQYFDCAPSQINYVLTTRFSSDRGYYIESRRGGGGYIKIIKVNINRDKYIQDLILNIIGDSITKSKAYGIIESFFEEDIVTEREYSLMKVALSDRTLSSVNCEKNIIRADILKNMLLVLLK